MSKKSLIERKRIVSGVQIEDFLKSYGFYNVVKDYEEYDNFTIVRYVYAITPFLKPSTPRVEFEVDEDDEGFIGGYIYLNGDKGENIDLKFMEDLKYFVENANYKNSDLTESKSTRILDLDEFLDAYESDSILNDKDEKIVVQLRHGKAEVYFANKDNINVTFLNENGNIFTKYFPNTTKGHVEMLSFIQERG